LRNDLLLGKFYSETSPWEIGDFLVLGLLEFGATSFICLSGKRVKDGAGKEDSLDVDAVPDAVLVK